MPSNSMSTISIPGLLGVGVTSVVGIGVPASPGMPQYSGPLPYSYNHPGSTFGLDVAIADRSPSTTAIIDGDRLEFETIEQKIDYLANAWRKFNRGRSVIVHNHAAYMQIIGIGSKALPILLRRLRDGESDMIVAMKYIAGDSPTTPEMRGNWKAIQSAWLKWGYDNGFGEALRG
jgi:hypothetical protein